MHERIVFGLYQSCGNRGIVGRYLCLGCGGVGGECIGGLDQGLEGWGGVRYVCPDSLCRWQLKVSVYCRVHTGQGKVRENFISSRSGKSQGI